MFYENQTFRTLGALKRSFIKKMSLFGRKLSEYAVFLLFHILCDFADSLIHNGEIRMLPTRRIHCDPIVVKRCFAAQYDFAIEFSKIEIYCSKPNEHANN